MTKLSTALLLAGLTMTYGVRAADASAAATETPKPAAPAARPTTIPPASSKQGVAFDKDIKPLFDASCVRCHGAQKPKANLRLDSLEGVLKGSEDGKILVVGDSAKSKLVTAIARINPKTAMPPEQRGPRRGGPGGPGGPGGEGRPPARDGAGEAHAAAGAPEKAGDTAKTGEAPARPPGGPGGQGGRPQGPPPKPLTAEEVGLVRAWIDQGAK